MNSQSSKIRDATTIDGGVVSYVATIDNRCTCLISDSTPATNNIAFLDSNTIEVDGVGATTPRTDMKDSVYVVTINDCVVKTVTLDGHTAMVWWQKRKDKEVGLEMPTPKILNIKVKEGKK